MRRHRGLGNPFREQLTESDPIRPVENPTLRSGGCPLDGGFWDKAWVLKILGRGEPCGHSQGLSGRRAWLLVVK